MTVQSAPVDSKIQHSGEDEVKHIRLVDIHADYDWNARSKANVDANVSRSADDAEEGTGLAGLCANIASSGQDEPVVLRKVENGKGLGGVKTDKPFELIAGFRRYEAISRIQTDKGLQDSRGPHGLLVPNTPNGTIRAVVKSLSPVQARSVNLRENTARSDMSTPDLVFGVRELVYLSKMPSEKVAIELNISKSYTDKLIRIAAVDRKILTHWRLGGEFEGIPVVKRVSVEDMATTVAQAPPDRQADEYKRLLAGKAEPKEDNQRIEACKKRAASAAALIATLEKAGFLKVNKNADWTTIVEIIAKPGKAGLNKRQTTSVAKVASAKYVEVLTTEESEEEEEGGEE